MSSPQYDAPAVEAKWQAAWEERKVYRAIASPAKPKFFATVPYPYVNGRQHLGFATSFLRAEFLTRFMRMTGHNVLFAQGFHCTGLPILGAAKRVAEGEPQQIEILRGMGIAEADIPKFRDPLHWVDLFPRETLQDLKQLGAAVDWSRSFITTSLNPPYDAFVRWQFRRLRDRKYVQIGKHPLIWCPRDQAPIGDHDRLEGEGVQPQEWTLLKFPVEDFFLIAATLRPETIFGQTNLWVDPEVPYVKAEVDGETWVLNRASAEKLGDQGHRVKVIGEIRGRDLVGRDALAPGVNRLIPILPTTFLDQGRGTGIVTSVPSDAPDDWVALRALQRDAALIRRFGLNPVRIAAIEPTPIIQTKGWGTLPGVEVVDRMGITGLEEREKLEAAKEEVYKAGYYRGVMRDVAGEFAGLAVEDARERIRRKLTGTGQAAPFWEPAESVVCRCLTRAIVKIVDEQWFLVYGDPTWKRATHEALDRVVLYPEAVRRQFHHTIDWLADWACAHHRGLGTSLPWDDRWVIESLSDSTVYMAYYTIAHALQEGQLRSAVPWAQKLTDAFFDYVFMGSGDSATVAREVGVDRRIVEGLRKEFLYWYPFDLRNTGKDLVQNHMTFCLFNHVALFPPELAPRGFGINGYVRLGGQKMSKSKGNVWYLRAALEEWGADVVRLLIANAGDGIDDPRLDVEFAESIRERMQEWYAFATTTGKTREDATPLDSWFRSVLTRQIRAAREAIRRMEYRAALRACFFELQAAWDWYVRRVGVPSRSVRDEFVDKQTRLLAVFAPHISEEVWQRIGKADFVVTATFPEDRVAAIAPEAEASEAFLRATLADAREILKVTGVAPRQLTFFVAPSWMAEARMIALDLARAGRHSMEALMDRARATPSLQSRLRELAGIAPKLIDEMRLRSPEDLGRMGIPVVERAYLEESKAFLERELGCPVLVQDADAPGISDPRGRARFAVPGRPAIYVE